MKDGMRAGASSAAGQRGVALVAVLWMVAALSLMVVGMSSVVRGETRMVTVSRQSVVLGALGTAAVHLVIQQMLSMPGQVTRLSYQTVSYQDHSIRVEIVPLNGLIDINNAPESLLAKLFAVQGGIDAAQAIQLARATLKARAAVDASGRAKGFEAIEDCLRVPGFGYALYARIRALMSADLLGAGSGRVNAMAAPREVLLVLTGGNAEQASKIAAARDAGQTGIDTTLLNPSEVDSAGTARYRLSAQVAASSTSRLRSVHTIDLAANPRDGARWRTFQVERHFESTLPGTAS